MILQNLKLPIDACLPDILKAITTNNQIIIQATPGAGKTTRVPPALLDVLPGKILVLEPRRMAAKLSAERVAAELNEKIGKTVGYQIRFENISGEETKIKYITEGIFTRQILSDPYLTNISCVIIDEFHERHLHTDIALMLVNFIQKNFRPDLKLIVMSATLDTEKLNNYLNEAKLFVSEGKNYFVEIEHSLDYELKKPLHILVYNAVIDLLNKNKYPGDFLVFLPGSSEIQRCAEVLDELALKRNLEIIRLKADSPKNEIQKLFAKSDKLKIILATNVAETSITLQGVTNVIDCGLAKVAGHASWSGMPTLDLLPISQSSIIQRTGRAGRTAPGIAKRLFTLNDYQTRQAYQKPEIQRADLTQMILELKVIQEKLKLNESLVDLPWFEKPANNIYQANLQLLRQIEAIDKNFNITLLGKEICFFPLHPRLGKILSTAKTNHCLPQSILIVSMINEGFLFKKNFNSQEIHNSDITFQLNLLKKSLQHEFLENELKNNIDKIAIQKINNLVHQLCHILHIQYEKCFAEITDEKISLILISAYPDRICQVRKQQKNNTSSLKELNLCLGGGAVLAKNSVVQDSEFLIAIDAEESATALSQANSTQIRIAHGIEAELLVYAPDEFTKDIEEYTWDKEAQRVKGNKKTLYGKLLLEEKYITENSEKFSEILYKELSAQWPKPFPDDFEYSNFKNKLNLATQNNISIKNIDIKKLELSYIQSFIAQNKKSFSEILEKSLEDYLKEIFDLEEIKILEKLFPNYIKIGKGRKVKIHYENDKPPWIASRLQDFFGTKETPKICNQSIPLVVHLLAPNMQSVQVTQDLSSFWQKSYHSVKKELSRRYPKHSWPDDPINAEPPELFKKK
ncbi:ATP-dependent helicase HrpB [Pigmentibacter sp. JX0631]|uniref:ATP-dependent helicase HrpB n=1 Tax=Pigmentibacter sp. JX0631 TaxID=2976982 RepID=UPI002469C5F9|nr:ATP-dependent helicase HrpB [Pigmentibacter sp. JX0631]WGL59079.1 ATP-dependent helicase HrpB [Pigmentibacter sp. JX0631]